MRSFSSANGVSDIRVVFSNDGTIDVRSGNLELGGSFPGGIPVTNAGNVTIEAGASLTVLSDYDQTAGSTTLNGGTFSGGNLNNQGGTLGGSGSINANVGCGGHLILGGTAARAQ